MLKKQGRVRWLDVGSRSFEDGFRCLDLAAPESIEKDKRDRYIQVNLLEVSYADLEALGEFDVVRLQHVFEHFAPKTDWSCCANCPVSLCLAAIFS